MYIDIQFLAGLGQFIRGLFFAWLLILSIREVVDQEADLMTWGLVFISSGNIIDAALTLFTTITIHSLSPDGFIPIKLANYAYIVSIWFLVGTWLQVAGCLPLAVALYRSKENDPSGGA